MLVATAPTLERALKLACDYFKSEVTATWSQYHDAFLLHNACGQIKTVIIRNKKGRYRLERTEEEPPKMRPLERPQCHCGAPAILGNKCGSHYKDQDDQRQMFSDHDASAAEPPPPPLVLTPPPSQKNDFQPSLFPTYNPRS